MEGCEVSAHVAALAPPRAHGPPPAHGVLRQQPEDFVVEEDLGFAPAGTGEHLLLKVRKRNANTQWVARELARIAGCRPGDIGYAGLKDRRAIAVQWFSVPRPRAAVNWQEIRGADFEVLEAHAHARKLPRGALAGNLFAIRIRVREVDGARLAALIAPRLGLDKAVARDRFLLGKATLLVLVATAAGAGIIASGLGHCGQHLRAEEDASFVPRPVGRRHIPRAAAGL